MYLTNTRPDICFAVNTMSQFLVEPRRVHLVAAKHVMRYLKGTLDFGLSYNGDHDFRLSGYTIQIGLEVSLTERALQDIKYCLSARQKQNTLLHVPPVVKPYGFGSC
jgi:hypothetical protein